MNLKNFGYEAIDYDIQNGFNETDIVIDLFKEIERAYNKEESIFDNITEKDMILAFSLAYVLKTKCRCTLEEQHFNKRNGQMSRS